MAKFKNNSHGRSTSLDSIIVVFQILRPPPARPRCPLPKLIEHFILCWSMVPLIKHLNIGFSQRGMAKCYVMLQALQLPRLDTAWHVVDPSSSVVPPPFTTCLHHGEKNQHTASPKPIVWQWGLIFDFTLNTLSCHHRFTNPIFYYGMNPVSVFSSSFETSSRVLLDKRASFVGWNIIRYSQLYMLLLSFFMTFRNIKVMCPLLRITQWCYFGILTMSSRESNITSDHITVVSVVQQREL